MVLKEGEVLRCPKCGGKSFVATAHVTQEGVMNEHGGFEGILDNCAEVEHEPDRNDLWECETCGYKFAGHELITCGVKEQPVKLLEDRVAECVFDISLMAQHMIEERRLAVEDSRSLFDSVLTWAKEFEAYWSTQDEDADYMEKIEEFAEEKLMAAYGCKSRFKMKVPMANPAALARGMVADLWHSDSEGSDRWSNYFGIAKATDDDDQSIVTVALGEEKHNLPESEWHYSVHLINDVDGSDCELYHTDHLSEDELVKLLADLMEKMKKGEL